MLRIGSEENETWGLSRNLDIWSNDNWKHTKRGKLNTGNCHLLVFCSPSLTQVDFSEFINYKPTKTQLLSKQQTDWISIIILGKNSDLEKNKVISFQELLVLNWVGKIFSNVTLIIRNQIMEWLCYCSYLPPVLSNPRFFFSFSFKKKT